MSFFRKGIRLPFLLYFLCFWGGIYLCFEISSVITHNHVQRTGFTENVCAFMYSYGKSYFWACILFFLAVFSFSYWGAKRKFKETQKNYFWKLLLFTVTIYSVVIGWLLYDGIMPMV